MIRTIYIFCLICLLFLFSACNSTPKYSPEIEAKAKAAADSLLQTAKDRIIGDTTGLYTCPVKIISAKLVRSDGGSYRNIHPVYKNDRDKAISAIKFRWKGENAFGDPADMGNLSFPGYGADFSDDGLEAHRTSSGTRDILSRDAKKVIMA